MAVVPKNKKNILRILKWFCLIAPVVFIVAFLLFFYIRYGKSFYPGISIDGESVGGKSYDEVSSIFKKRADLIIKNGLVLNITGTKGTKTVQVPMFLNGLTSDKVVEYFSLNDWEKTIKEAFFVGRGGSFWQNIKEQATAAFQKRNFLFSPIVQKDPLNSFLSDETDDFFIKSSPASFLYSNNKASVAPETIGEKVDIEKVVSAFSQKLSLLDATPLNLNSEKDYPSVSKKDLEPFLDFAEKISDSVSVVFHYKDYSWKISGSELVTWLTIRQNKVGIDEQKLQDYFNKTAILYIDSPMQNSRFEMKDSKLVEITPGHAGNVVDVAKNMQEIEDNISNITNTKNVVIDIPIETTKQDPKITKETIDKYKIIELVGEADTNFQGGSLDRQHNIETGASKLNGILISPGEEFSAVNAIGDVTEEAGFVKEYVIDGGRTQKEIGGGLCQVATTLFRAALNAGLPIAERVNHRYVISYYGAGLDATIYGPHPDLRFINDTGNYLLLQGKAENNQVTFEFYGKKDGRTVEISEPKLYNKTFPPPTKNISTADLPAGKTKCTEIPHNGITADTTYTVAYPNGEKKETNFHSVYQPWQKVCLVGTGI